MDNYGYPREEAGEEQTQSSYYSKTSYGYGQPGSDSNDPSFTEEDYNNPNPNYPQPPNSKHNPGPDPVQYGGMATHSENQPGSEFFLHVDPTVDNDDEPDFELSNCGGKKRALLIGINYTGTANELSGCLNDVDDIVVLTDDQEEDKFKPTRANILAGMKWLVNDAQPDDSFFFHYSGHGGRVHDIHSDEDDSYDETIYPLDFEHFDGDSGQIKDDDMHDIMVRPLPPKCRLTAIFDSCHSGTVLDLPYVYSTKGEIKEKSLFKHASQGIFSAGIAYARGDRDGALSSIMSLGKQFFESRNIADEVRRKNTSHADVIMFSGCKDDQTSADAQEAGKATGAMSYAFITTLRKNPNQSYQQLLNSVRDILADRYEQRPQMSSSHPIDVNLEFKC
ncbi:hypothetical protein INT48_007341 [Thamnidium elegans]|uniref:Peptidase C14 caspase domain-containing protein n=1 Tax=Thamnidium elegans TaxID=101142 RepID=A0A8H7SU95_9FUNG|nr:hypothetical protein INT48_007341 [Thamnidium elegans]